MEEFSFSLLDFQLFLFFNCLIFILFFIWKNFFFPLNRKIQAWLIMLISSFILTLTGFYFAITAEMNRELYWTVSYIYSDHLFSRVILIFFTSCNIMDLGLGFFYYKEFLYPLTTICHHIFFIFIVIIFLGTHTTTGFLITFVFELPTFLLSLGTIWPSLRNDLLFGITFFLTRICFHILSVYRLASLGFDGIAWKVLCLPFILHLHWFYKWIGSFFGDKKKKKKNKEEEQKIS